MMHKEKSKCQVIIISYPLKFLKHTCIVYSKHLEDLS